MDIAMRPASRTSPSRPKPFEFRREKTPLSVGVSTAIPMMFSSISPVQGDAAILARDVDAVLLACSAKPWACPHEAPLPAPSSGRR